jgi:hypothetical protein
MHLKIYLYYERVMPRRGVGANIALRDALRLPDPLVAADRGERSPHRRPSTPMAGIVDYGFLGNE